MVLTSWQEIAAYLHRGIRTVQRWEVTLRMPVHRDGSNPRGPVKAFKHELDAWMANVAKARRAREGISKTPVVLNTWKEIAGHMHRGVRTVQRWEATLGCRYGALAPRHVLQSLPSSTSLMAGCQALEVPPRGTAPPPTAQRPLSKAGTSLNAEQVDFRVNLNAEDSALLRKGGGA